LRNIILKLDTSDLDQSIKQLSDLIQNLHKLSVDERNSFAEIVENLHIELSLMNSQFKSQIRALIRTEIRKLAKKNSSR